MVPGPRSGKTYYIKNQDVTRWANLTKNRVITQQTSDGGYSYSRIKPSKGMVTKDDIRPDTPESVKRLEAETGQQAEFYPRLGGRGFFRLNGKHYDPTGKGIHSTEEDRVKAVAESRETSLPGQEEIKSQKAKFTKALTPRGAATFANSQLIAGSLDSYVEDHFGVDPDTDKKLEPFAREKRKMNAQEFCNILATLDPDDAMISVRETVKDDAVANRMYECLGYAYPAKTLLVVAALTGREFSDLARIAREDDGGEQIQRILEEHGEKSPPRVTLDAKRLAAIVNKAEGSFHTAEVTYGTRSRYAHSAKRLAYGIAEKAGDMAAMPSNTWGELKFVGGKRYKEDYDRAMKQGGSALDFMKHNGTFSTEELKTVDQSKDPWDTLGKIVAGKYDDSEYTALRNRQADANRRDTYHLPQSEDGTQIFIESAAEIAATSAMYIALAEKEGVKTALKVISMGGKATQEFLQGLQKEKEPAGKVLLKAAAGAALDWSVDSASSKALNSIFPKDSSVNDMLSDRAVDAVNAIQSGFKARYIDKHIKE